MNLHSADTSVRWMQTPIFMKAILFYWTKLAKSGHFKGLHLSSKNSAEGSFNIVQQCHFKPTVKVGSRLFQIEALTDWTLYKEQAVPSCTVLHSSLCYCTKGLIMTCYCTIFNIFIRTFLE